MKLRRFRWELTLAKARTVAWLKCGRASFASWVSDKGTTAMRRGYWELSGFLILLAHTVNPYDLAIKRPTANYYRWWDRNRMKAKVVYVDPHDCAETIAVNGHQLQYGGSGGDGFCYSHQSFECMDNLTTEEELAVRNAGRSNRS